MKRLWLDLGEFGHLLGLGSPIQSWQDHGLGLLRTIMHAKGLKTDLASLRLCLSYDDLEPLVSGYDMLLMNVRSYTFPHAVVAARMFKKLNPSGLVLVGGMHASVDIEAMKAIEAFDKICQGGGENAICDLVEDPSSFPRVFTGQQSKSLADWPEIDRRLWPRQKMPSRYPECWPLEVDCNWGPPPVATVITSRVCPWRCCFCNEFAFIPNMDRRPVDMVIDELNHLDAQYGPLGSVVIHDSIAADTRVFVKGRGIVRIDSLKPETLLSIGNHQHVGECGLEVASDDGPKTASYWTDEGDADTLKVTLRNGLDLTMTKGHRIRIVRDEQYVWSRADDLRFGDYVPVQAGMETWGDYQRVEVSYDLIRGVGRVKGATRAYPQTLNLTVDEDFGWLLGFFIGDGTQSARKSAWFLSWACNRPELADRVQAECRRLFGKHTSRFWQYPGKLEIVHLTSKLAVLLFQKIMGAEGERQRKKLAVPEVIFRSPKSVVEAFIKGLHDADGYRAVGGQSESISTISKELAQGVALLLLNMGNNPVIYTRKQDIKAKGYHTHQIYYTLYLHKTRDSIPLSRDVTWKHSGPGWSSRPARQPRVNRATLAVLEPEHDLLKRTQFYVPILAIEATERQRVYDLTVPDGESFVANGVISHNSMFFQHPAYVTEWLEKYPRKTNTAWPYWAAARADTVRRWPELFEALVRETNWTTVSIGFESGSDRVLKILNKECTVEDNQFTIELLNKIGDDLERQGKERPRFWANVMFGIPGERREDVFATMRMIRRMKGAIVTPATYSPYPGSLLGYQITAEGKSNLGEQHVRFAGGHYMKGIDYEFLDDVFTGAYELEIAERGWP